MRSVLQAVYGHFGMTLAALGAMHSRSFRRSQQRPLARGPSFVRIRTTVVRVRTIVIGRGREETYLRASGPASGRRIRKPARVIPRSTMTEALQERAALRNSLEEKGRDVESLSEWRPEPESNRRARICSPLRNHSAIGPGVREPCRDRRPPVNPCYVQGLSIDDGWPTAALPV